MSKWSYIPLRVMTEPRGLLFKIGAACRWVYYRNTDSFCTFLRILGWQRIYPAATKEGDTHADPR